MEYNFIETIKEGVLFVKYDKLYSVKNTYSDGDDIVDCVIECKSNPSLVGTAIEFDCSIVHELILEYLRSIKILSTLSSSLTTFSVLSSIESSNLCRF